MRSRFIVIVLALIVGGAGFSALLQQPSLSEGPMATTEIDFTVLHQQANDALDNLRRLQQRRQASAGPAGF